MKFILVMYSPIILVGAITVILIILGLPNERFRIIGAGFGLGWYFGLIVGAYLGGKEHN